MILVASCALAALVAVPAHAEDQWVQTCAGMSSASDGTWTFTAGSEWAFGLIHGEVNPESTICSYGNTRNTDPLQMAGLAFSKLNLQGTGDFSCANGGNGSLTGTPPSGEPQNTNYMYAGDLLDSDISWTATFSHGVGKLSGTIDPRGAVAPQPVTGYIVVNCNAPTNVAAPNTYSVLTNAPH